VGNSPNLRSGKVAIGGSGSICRGSGSWKFYWPEDWNHHGSKFCTSFKKASRGGVKPTDACKGELFALWGKAQELVQSGGVERVTSPEKLIQILSQQILAEGKKGRWVAVGEGRKRYPELWAQLPLSQELVSPLLGADFVQGRMLGQLAWEAYQQGRAQDALSVFPSYLRASDAELKLKAGLLKTVGL